MTSVIPLVVHGSTAHEGAAGDTPTPTHTHQSSTGDVCDSVVLAALISMLLEYSNHVNVAIVRLLGDSNCVNVVDVPRTPTVTVTGLSGNGSYLPGRAVDSSIWND